MILGIVLIVIGAAFFKLADMIGDRRAKRDNSPLPFLYPSLLAIAMGVVCFLVGVVLLHY
jgi:H+/Cl- antiporter ClcA